MSIILIGILSFIGVGTVFFVLGESYMSIAETEENAVLGKTQIDEVNEYPILPITFNTFLTIYESFSEKIDFFTDSTDPERPKIKAILYDRNKNGSPDIRIAMSTRKDAKKLIQWFRTMAEENLARERQEANIRASQELLRSAESMQKDIDALQDETRQEISALTEKNKQWRQTVKQRQEHIRKGTFQNGTVELEEKRTGRL